MKRLALFALLLATPALAQDATVETVTVNGSSLTGVWRGTLVQSQFWGGLLGALTRVRPPAFGQMADTYCRIAAAKDELEMLCLQFGSNGQVTTEDGIVRIGSGRTAFQGALADPNRLRGHFRYRSWLGMIEENPTVAEAVRVASQADAPDRAGKGALLRRILEQGLAAVPQDTDAMKKNGSILILPELGAVQSLSYLGQETKWDWPPPPGSKLDIFNIPNRPDFFSVYLVRFTQGERLCGLHQRDDGVLDAFRCA